MKQIAEFIEDLRREHQVPAVQVGVFRGTETVFLGGSGYADVEKGLKAGANTTFAIGSQTKGFVATALAVLADEGKIQWDKPIKEYIPEFAMDDGYRGDTLTVRDILSHRSGVPNHEFMLQLNLDNYSAGEFVQKIRYLKANTAVRTRMQYSNLMYLLAGYLLERVAGEPWSDFIRKRLLEPIGMCDTNFSVMENSEREDKAQPYGLSEGRAVRLPWEDIKAAAPAGAMNSTLADMLKWLRFHLDHGIAGGHVIVSADNLRECHSPQVIIRENPPIFKGEMQFRGYGLGWFTECYRGHWVVHHGGGIDGFITEIGIIPDLDAGYAIYTNLNNNFVPPILQFSILDFLMGLPEVDWNQRFNEMRATGQMLFSRHVGSFQPDASDSAKGLPPENYAGTYRNEAYGRIVIRQDGENLVFQARKLEAPMRHVNHNAFLLLREDKMLAVPMQFILDMHGRVTGVDVDFEPSIGAMIRYGKEENKPGA